MCINNNQLMDTVMTEIYPKELVLTNDGAVSHCHYLDLDLEIRNGKIHSKLYDKRDAFGFSIVNYPYLSGNIPTKESYGVFVSQLIRYARCCMSAVDFISRTKILVLLFVNLPTKVSKNQSYDEYSRNLQQTIMSFYSNTINLSNICYIVADRKTNNGLFWIMLGQLNTHRVSGSHLPLNLSMIAKRQTMGCFGLC